MNFKQLLGSFGLVCGLLLSQQAGFSATRTYVGGGGDNNWSTGLNWDDGIGPVSGDDLQFGNSGDLTINNDLSPNFSISGITFQGGVPSTTLTGNAVDFDGGLVNISGNAQHLSLGLNLVGSGALAIAGNLTIGGPISGSGDMALIGATVSLNSANTYSGLTYLGSDLQLGANDALGTGGIEFAGGALSANSFSDSTIGTLTLSSVSTLSLDAGGAAGSLTFDDATYSGGTLFIDGWSGLAGSAGTDDKIFITGNTGGILPNLQFVGFSLGAIQLGSGEIVPVPEPTEWALIAFVFLAVLYKFVLPRDLTPKKWT